MKTCLFPHLFCLSFSFFTWLFLVWPSLLPPSKSTEVVQYATATRPWSFHSSTLQACTKPSPFSHRNSIKSSIWQLNNQAWTTKITIFCPLQKYPNISHQKFIAKHLMETDLQWENPNTSWSPSLCQETCLKKLLHKQFEKKIRKKWNKLFHNLIQFTLKVASVCSVNSANYWKLLGFFALKYLFHVQMGLNDQCQ